ncbi:MAG: hypothetical protein HY774_22485 [Acidobacteria bacterium]|nr:hypothetical protein [Acidobacteriota bacterium]
MNSFFEHWYLSLLPLAGYLLLAVISMKRISDVRTQLGDVIRTRKDLELVKAAINQNMKLAFLLILGGGGYLVLLLGLLAAKMLPSSDSRHLIIFTVVMAVSSLVIHILEKPLKTLRVEAKDPRIAQTYQIWLSQWPQARWKLQDDVFETLPLPPVFGASPVQSETRPESHRGQAHVPVPGPPPISLNVKKELTLLPPRPIRRRSGRGWLIGFQQIFILPHTLVGIGLIMFMIGSWLFLVFGTTVPAQVTELKTTRGSKNTTAYEVHFRYQHFGSDHRDQTTVPKAVFDTFHQNDVVEVKVFPLPGTKFTQLKYPGAMDAHIVKVMVSTGMALFWNGIVSVFLWAFYIRPLINRWLVRNGWPAPGRITGKSVSSGKSTSYYVEYQFDVPKEGTQQGKMEVSADAYALVNNGDMVSVLYSSTNPRWSVVYEVADYEVMTNPY